MTVALESTYKIAELKEACFSGETLVLVTYGDGNDLNDVHFEAIEYLKVGAKVLSRDEATGEMAFRRVLKFYNNGYREVYDIYISGPEIDEKFGDPTRKSPLGATPDHPFWVQGKGWTPARELKPGDEFLTYDDNPLIVDRVEPAVYPATVFNLEVEDFNTYFVGGGIWVHNCNNKLKGKAGVPTFTQELKLTNSEAVAKGEPHRQVPKNENDPDNIRANEGENAAGDILAKHELEVIQLPGKPSQPPLGKSGKRGFGCITRSAV
jgi:hypothetical protein